MRTLRAPIVALCFGLAALPANAGGFSFDLPRLDFPAPGTDSSRDCTPPLLAVAPDPCAAPGN